MSALLVQLVLLATQVVDETPEPEDVKAGWTAFAVFLLLIGAVVLLGFSLTKHLRRAEAAEKAGLYGSDKPAEDAEDAEDADTETEPHQAP
jgi:hypothetical protein